MNKQIALPFLKEEVLVRASSFFSGVGIGQTRREIKEMTQKQREYWKRRYEKLASMSVELPRELREELRDAAKQEGVSSGEFIRRAIRERLGN